MSDPVIFRGRMYPSAMEALRGEFPDLCIAEPPVPVRVMPWHDVVDGLEPSDWRADIERKAAAAKAATARDAWWLRGRINYQCQALLAEFGRCRYPSAMVTLP